MRFEYSPGRRDPLFLGNQSAFDAAIELDIGGGLLGLIGIETKYHEHAVVAAVPKAPALARYLEVTERSGAFTDGWRERVVGTALQQIWQDHLLALSMLQHPSGRWAWTRFVLLYPAANASFARAATAYRTLLRDTTTFEARTIDELIAAPEALPGITKARLPGEIFLRPAADDRRQRSLGARSGRRHFKGGWPAKLLLVPRHARPVSKRL